MLCTFAADNSSLISALRACCSGVPLFLRAILSTSKVVLFPLYTTLEVYTRFGMDSAYYEDGSTCYVYYDCAMCNRAAVGMANETLGDFGDLNGDVMKQWLALYTTKDKRAGSPIKAGFTKKVGSGSAPMGKTLLSFFSYDYAVNMTDTRFTYNDKKQGIYLYYKSTGNTLTASAFNSNAYAMIGMLSALGGAGICYAMITLLGRRKKKTETTA